MCDQCAWEDSGEKHHTRVDFHNPLSLFLFISMVILNHITACRENYSIDFPGLLSSFSVREIKPFLNESEFNESEHRSKHKCILFDDLRSGWWNEMIICEHGSSRSEALWIGLGLAVLMRRSHSLTACSNILGQNWTHTYTWLLIFSSFSAANSLIQPSVLHGLFAAVDCVMPIFIIFGQWIRAVCHDT